MAGRVPGAGGQLTPERLSALLGAALPEEQLSAEELSATLFDDPDGEVLGADDGAIGVALRGDDGYVTVVVVDPGAQRRGIGRSLLAEGESWLRERGATRVVTGAAAPRYLWPGVDDVAHAAALALFGSAGYEPVAAHRNHRCSTSFRSIAPDGVDVRRVRAGTPDADAVLAFTAAAFPQWVDEVSRAVPNGCCHAAFALDDGAATGFGCHSVNRAGWIGPMATDPSRQRRGVGAALLGAVCRDLELAELDEAEIAWVGPDEFYEKTAGSTVSRRFTVLAKPL